MFRALRASPPAARTTSSRRSAERHELEELTAAEERRVDLEVRVLRRRPDQRQEARLDRRQERVLLTLVEAVDLVQEEDRAASVAAQPVAGLAQHPAHVAHADLHRRELLEVRLRRRRDDPGERRLAAPRRPEEDHRRHPVGGDRPPQRAV
jgi:hypothetical protein